MGWSVYPTLPSWTWPGQEGKPLTVDVYSGAESVRLYLNDKLIGEKPTGRDQAFKAEFEVPYAPGTLKAEGVRGGKVVADSILQTTGDAVRLKLTADRTDLSADGQDLAFVTVEAVDEKGRLQMNSDQKVHFAVSWGRNASPQLEMATDNPWTHTQVTSAASSTGVLSLFCARPARRARSSSPRTVRVCWCPRWSSNQSQQKLCLIFNRLR